MTENKPEYVLLLTAAPLHSKYPAGTLAAALQKTQPVGTLSGVAKLKLPLESVVKKPPLTIVEGKVKVTFPDREEGDFKATKGEPLES